MAENVGLPEGFKIVHRAQSATLPEGFKLVQKAPVSKMTPEQKAIAQEQSQKWLAENRPLSTGDKLAEAMVTNPALRGVGFGLQGMAHSGLNPFGSAMRAAGVDTKPLGESQTAGERASELAGQYGTDAALIYEALAAATPAAAVATPSLKANVLNTLTKGGLPNWLATSTGGAVVEGVTNPTNPFEQVVANVVGSGAAGSVLGGLTKTATQTAGWLKNALPNESANAALSKGVRADKGVARTIIKDAPRAYNELNDDMVAALDRAIGRKLNIENALDTQQERYNKFIYRNADNPVYMTEETKNAYKTGGKISKEEAENILRAEMQKENPIAVKQNLPTLKEIAQGLSDNQKQVLNEVINEGAEKVTNPRGSLRAVHRALEVLNKRIDNTINENPLRPRSAQDADVRDLMQVKGRINQLLEIGGIKPFDAGISKAKTLRSSFEEGYNFKPSETKFENLGLKTARDKRAFLQGRLAKLQDNVLSDGGTNLATVVKKDENTLKKLVSDAKFKELMNSANSIEEQFKRLKSIETQANNELLKDIERGASPMRENIESRGSVKGRALDILLGAVNRRSRRKLAEAYLNPEIDEIIRRGGFVGAGKGLSAAATRQLMIDQLNNQ